MFSKLKRGKSEREGGSGAAVEGPEGDSITFRLRRGPGPHVGQRVDFQGPLRGRRGRGTVGQGWLHQQLGPGRHPRHGGRLDVGADRGHAARGRHPQRGRVSVGRDLGRRHGPSAPRASLAAPRWLRTSPSQV